MFLSVNLIGQNLVKDDVLGSLEEVFLNLGVILFQLRNEAFDFEALGGGSFVRMFKAELLGEAAGALEKVKSVVVAEAADVLLSHEVHGADEFHAGEVSALQLGHHGLILAGVEHAHEDGLDHIVVVMAEGNFVAAQLLRMAVEIAAAHARAQIAGGFFDFIDRVKNLRLEDGQRNAEKLCVALDERAVRVAVTRVHDQKDQFEGNFIAALELLKELRHQHGVFAAGDADRDFVAGLNHLIVDDGFDEGIEERDFILLPD